MTATHTSPKKTHDDEAFDVLIRYMGLVLIMLFVFALWSTRLTEPLIGRHDNSIAQVVLSSDNYDRYGLAQMGLLYVFDADPTYEQPQIFYVSGPGTSALITALLKPLFGSTIFTSRLMTTLITLLGAAAFYQFVRRSWGWQTAFAAFAVYLLVPVTAFYGQSPLPDMLAATGLSFILLAYQTYEKRPSALWAGLLVLSLMFNSLVSLAMFFVAPVLCLHALLFASRRWRLITIIVVSTLVAKLLWLLPGMIIYPAFMETWLGRFAVRGFITAEPLWDNLLDYLWTIGWSRYRIRYTEVVLVLSAAGMVLLALQLRRPRLRSASFLIWMVILAGAAPIYLFAEAYYRHDFMVLTLLHGIAMTAALAMIWRWRQLRAAQSLKRFAMGGLMLLLAVGFAASWLRWTLDMYRTEDPFPLTVGTAIAERVPAGEFLYTNMPWSAATWYYAQRDLLPLTDIPAGQTEDVYRLVCEVVESEDSPDADIFMIENNRCEFFLPSP